MKIRFLLSALLFLAFIIPSCRIDSLNDIQQDNDYEELIDYVLSTYLLLKSSDDTAAASARRATIPVWTMTSAPVLADGTTGTIANYPERGQETDFTITQAVARDAAAEVSGVRVLDEGTDATGIFQIVADTTYPRIKRNNFNTIALTRETCLIKDSDSDGLWTEADEVVDSSGIADGKYRIRFDTTFRDGSVRYAMILADKTDGLDFAPFPIDGSLDFPASEYSPEPFAGTDPADFQWASTVVYYQEVERHFLFWKKAFKKIVGVRYYAEHLDYDGATQDSPLKTSVSFERMTTTTAEDATASNRTERINGQLEKLFIADTEGLISMTDSAATLSESVIRYRILPNGAKEVRMQTYVVNNFGADFSILASQEETEEGNIQNADISVNFEEIESLF